MKKNSVVGIILALLCMCLTLVGCGISEKETETSQLSTENDTSIIAEDDANSIEYRVLNVYQYPAIVSNNAGGIINYENRYHVTFTDEKSIFHMELHPSNNKHALHQVKFGDEVVLVNKNDRYILFLTEEMLVNMPIA